MDKKSSPPPPRRRYRTTALKDMLEPLASKAFKARGFAETRMLAEWEKIVGVTLAKVCKPQKIRFPAKSRSGGTLYLRVDAGWNTEIQHLEPIILDKIATYFGYRAVSNLRIIQHIPAEEPV